MQGKINEILKKLDKLDSIEEDIKDLKKRVEDYEKSIESIIEHMRDLAPIVRHYDGYIVLAQNEKDFNSKVRKIQYGDTNGFYTVESLINNINI